MKLSISSYSFNRFGAGPEADAMPTFRGMLERCNELGIDGIELLGVHFPSTDREALNQLKQDAARTGVQLVAVSAHHNFVNPDPMDRRQNIDTLCKWVDVADAIGAPIVRAFGGRWNTAADFDALMAERGYEPPLSGYTHDDGYTWSIEAFQIASYYAGRRGVTLALENHWGFTATATGVKRILAGTHSPWLKVALDTGNFNYSDDQYAEMAELAPEAIIVHAKTYFGGGQYYDAGLDYPRIGNVLRAAGYKGYVSIEFEGKAHPDQGIPLSVDLVRTALR